jgi:protein-S-isoprenylcysteine O-methyltransferase Ste14
MATASLPLRPRSLVAARATSEPFLVKLLLTAIAVGFLVLFLVLPLVTVFVQAFEKGAGAYFAALREPMAVSALKLTLLTAGVAVPLNLLFGVAASWAIAKFDFPGKNALITLIDLPFGVSPVISGMVFILLFGRQGKTGYVSVGDPGATLFARATRYRLPEAERGLATSGPYAFMRNPVYIANMLMFAGLCVLCELPWAIPLVCAWAFIVYNIGIRFEEQRLRKRYGEAYTDFCERTPRWIPHHPVWMAVRAAPAASLRCALRAEWQCLCLLLIPIAKELFFQRYIE